MKNKMKKIINFILLVILSIIGFITIKTMPHFLLKTIALDKIIPKILSITTPPDSFYVTLDNYSYGEVIHITSLDQIYCREKGGHFQRADLVDTVSIETLQQEARIINSGNNYKCKTKPTVPTHKSYVYYKKVGVENYSKGEANAEKAEHAYIVTYNGNEWSPDKQYAIWQTSLNEGDSVTASAGGQKIYENGKAYGQFAATEIAKMNNASYTKNNDLVSVNQTDKEYIIGPYKLDYGYLKSDVTFGGIKQMYVVTDNGNRNIDAFIINGSRVAPSYFTPDDINKEDTRGDAGQGYPKPGEEFYVVIKANSEINAKEIYVQFAWLEIESSIVKYGPGIQYQINVTYDKENKHLECNGHNPGHNSNCETDDDGNYTCTTDHSYKHEVYDTAPESEQCWDNKATATVDPTSQAFQRLLAAAADGERKIEYKDLTIPVTPQPKNLLIKLAGYVWEDENNDKESLPNGIKDKNEKWKNGVEVILHYADGTEVARTVTHGTENGKEKGYYEFNDLDSQKKYYVEFVYDGQIYQATTYDKKIGEEQRLTDNVNGKIRSSATEIQGDKDKLGTRENFNYNFAEIKSAPSNYKVRRALYKKVGETNTAWIISKESSETTYGIKEIYNYVIYEATAQKSYSKAYATALNKFSSDKDIKSKLQFIEDCRISSYTGFNGSYQTYPIWEKFTINGSRTIAGDSYPNIYPLHLNIDFGLNKREEFDLALVKDVQKATIKINGKTHTYTYDSLAEFKCNTCNHTGKVEDLTFDPDSEKPICPNCSGNDVHYLWDIGVRLSDAYYRANGSDVTYSRELFSEDYQYKASRYVDENGNDISAALGKDKKDELEVYITYRVGVRNQSQSILGTITEVADYFDEDYEYIEELDGKLVSYIQIPRGVDVNKEGMPSFNKKDQLPIKQSPDSYYPEANSEKIKGYNKLYVHGLEDYKLTSGQTAYIYLTFRVKKDTINEEDWIRLDETVSSASPIGVGKENIAEINGFKTFYRNGTQIPNVTDEKGVDGYKKVAGLFDCDSVPGNVDDAIAHYKKEEISLSQNKSNVTVEGFKDIEGKISKSDLVKEIIEDDSDKAPNIRLVLYRDGNGNVKYRTIAGQAWEDERNNTNDSQKTTVGNGQMDNLETKINGVTVQLVELMDNGTEYVWKEFSTGQSIRGDMKPYDPVIPTIYGYRRTTESGIQEGKDESVTIPSDTPTPTEAEGYYSFWSYVPGNYIVRYIYGDTTKTVLVDGQSDKVSNAYGKKGWNAKSYNGQDYKTTTYQTGIVQTNSSDVFENNTSGSYTYNITASETTNVRVSDAKDIMTDSNNNDAYKRPDATLNSRLDVIDYSDNNIRNHIAEVLASHQNLPQDPSKLRDELNELMQYTQMTAETGRMVIEVEYDREDTGNQVNDNKSDYDIRHVDLGLEERPKAQLAINKEVTNVKLTLVDGSTLFDAVKDVKAQNVMWVPHKKYTSAEDSYFDNNKKMFKVDQDNKSINPMEAVRKENADNNDLIFGLIQLSMDEELMHGATIKVSYKVTVTNIGEVDYQEAQFYYTGIVNDMNNTIVKTMANQVIDYVPNNMQFYAVDNNAWEVIDKDTLVTDDDSTLVNKTLSAEVDKYNTIIKIKSDSKIATTPLVPKAYDDNEEKCSVSDDLILTQLITPENKEDDLTYRNIVEIVETSNDVGRRMAYSIVGNQNPKEEPKEVDSDRAQIVKILPPYGENRITPYIIGISVIIASTLLLGGTIFIARKVSKKNQI